MNEDKWYVLQTRTNEEEKLVLLIQKILGEEAGLFSKCFVPKCENVWRRGGKSNVEVEILFPGYIFIISNHPKELYQALKKIPQLSKIIREDNKKDTMYLLDLLPSEELFMENLLDMNRYQDGIVHRSYIRRGEDGRIKEAEAPLKNFMDKIVSVDFKHRRAFVELDILGKRRRIKLSIMDEADLENERK